MSSLHTDSRSQWPGLTCLRPGAADSPWEVWWTISHNNTVLLLYPPWWDLASRWPDNPYCVMICLWWLIRDNGTPGVHNNNGIIWRVQCIQCFIIHVRIILWKILSKSEIPQNYTNITHMSLTSCPKLDISITNLIKEDPLQNPGSNVSKKQIVHAFHKMYLSIASFFTKLKYNWLYHIKVETRVL